MTAGTYAAMRSRLLSRLEEFDGDTIGGAALDEVVDDIVDGYEAEAGAGIPDAPPLRDVGEMKRRLVDSVAGFGPLQTVFDDPGTEEIFLEGDRVTFLDGEGRLRPAPIPATEAEVLHIVKRLLAPTDWHVDASNPIVQARVLDGTARLTAVMPPVSDRLSATVRRYSLRRESLRHLVELRSLTRAAAGFLHAIMQVQSSVLVSGPPGAGKTSLLAALLHAVPGTHCVRCVEEVRELHVPLSPTSSFYEARPQGPDGSGEIPLRALVKLVLAMRPDRIVVGEVRGAEAPRFEGHQPGRDSVQGRRRCRMRRQSSMVSGRASESVSQGR